MGQVHALAVGSEEGGALQTWHDLLASRGQASSVQIAPSKCHKVTVLIRSETLSWWKPFLPVYARAV